MLPYVKKSIADFKADCQFELGGKKSFHYSFLIAKETSELHEVFSWVSKPGCKEGGKKYTR